MKAGHYHHQGFTMIELITVMILVGILAAFAAPRLGDIKGFSGPGYAADVRGALAQERRNIMLA